jgi:3-deoxy-D-manno-octulosonic-acid transferase
MLTLYDIAYTAGLWLSCPYWLARPSARRKVLGALAQRRGDVLPRTSERPAVFIHAVSVGEINATPALIASLRTARPSLEFIVSTTTNDGFARGRELYGRAADVTLIRYPLDFSSCVNRVLERLQPGVVVLMELEVWPNFLLACVRRGIGVVLGNGRLTEASFHRYRRIRPVASRMFGRLSAICAQDATYAQRFTELGVAPQRVQVCGTMKFDTAGVADTVPGAGELASALGLLPGQKVWVCGSTGPGEEHIVLQAYRQLLGKHPHLRLAIVPRHRARFDEAAVLIQQNQFSLVRRSQPDSAKEISGSGAGLPVILGDTMGELRQFYSLADVVFVGRSLVDLGHRQHGSDMIEPAALAKPVVVGPYTTNFAEPMNLFLQADAMRLVRDASELALAIGKMLDAPEQAAQMGRRAQEVVRRNRGATARHVQIILEVLDRPRALCR